MLKRVLIFAATFAIALGGATGVVVMRTKRSVPAAKAAGDSAAVAKGRDSSAVRDTTAAADSLRARKDTTPVARSAVELGRDTVREAAARTTVRDSVKATVPPPAAVPPALPGPGVTTAQAISPVAPLLASGRLGKIFGAMAARDAAKVLEQMDDADIKEILARLNDKKAAEILALLPSARAATISKTALANRGAGK